MSGVKSVIAESQTNAQIGKINQPTPRLGLFNRKAKLAAWQNQLNTQYQDKQNEYNSPVNQMARYREAGLNPHLMYGQGTPGNQSSVQQATGYEPRGILETAINVIGVINQTAMMASQRAAIDANVQRTKIQTSNEAIKGEILQRNPLLNDTVFESELSRIISKGQQQGAETQSSIAEFQTKAEQLKSAQRQNKISDMYMETKIAKEVELLFQRFKLNEADLKIKAEILNSKEFLNEFSRLEMEFIKSGNMNFGHWAAFGKLLLSKIGGLKAR